MQDTHRGLITFFDKIAKKDSVLLEKLRHDPHFQIDSKAWQFTLPALFSFLQSNEDDYSEIDYIQFRKILFQCPINQTIKNNRAQIIISKNCNNVDESNYKLVWPN